jgi:polar amino acid transport system permease protein
MNWLENLRRSFLDWESMAEVLPNMLVVGLKNTIILAFASTVLGTVIGMILAVMGMSHSKWLRIPARIYTDVFRGLPAIVTILLIGQGFARIGRDFWAVALPARHYCAQSYRRRLYR